jgi:hypothetical protein
MAPVMMTATRSIGHQALEDAAPVPRADPTERAPPLHPDRPSDEQVVRVTRVLGRLGELARRGVRAAGRSSPPPKTGVQSAFV